MTAELQIRIQDDVKDALRASDKERLATLRLILTEIKNKSLELRRDADEGEILGLVQKAIKQRGEAAKLYDEGGRAELADKERREAAVLEDYLPPRLDDAEVEARIRALVEAEGLEGPAAIGVIMKTLLPELGGAVDGGTLNRLARQVLAGDGS